MPEILSDVVLPNSVLYEGVSGKAMRNNQRVSNDAGFMTVTSQSLVTLRQYELGFNPMQMAQWKAIYALFEVTDGGAYGFLMEDPSDSLVSAAPLQPFNSVNVGAAGVGYGVPVYQLVNRYTSVGSTRYRDRKIRRPMANAVLFRGASQVTLGAAAGNAALDFTTGLVTFVPDASATATAIAVGASTQVTLSGALGGLAVGGMLWLEGFTGANASLLNNLSHTVTAITGAVYTIATSTVAAAIIAGGVSKGKKYPQPSEQLTWNGSFYVPVQFATDEIDWQLTAAGADRKGRYFSGPSVQLVEVRE